MAMEFDIAIDPNTNESPDVTHGVMTVETTVQGEPRSVTVQVTTDQETAGPFYASEDTEVRASLRWVDNVGLESPSSDLVATITDTIPPDAPGPLGVTNLREIPDDQVPPVA